MQQQQEKLRVYLDKLIHEQKFTEAIECFSPVLASDPNNPVKLHLMGDLHRQSGDKLQAESYFRRAIKANPKDLGPYLNMTTMFYADKNYKEAEKILKKAIKVAPRSALLHGHLGAVLQEQGLLKESLEEMKLSKELNPANPKIHNNLGVVYQRQRNPDEAKACFEKALEVDGAYVEPRRNLARYWRLMGEVEKAEESWRSIREEHPKSWEDAQELAEFYIDYDRPTDALDIYQEFDDVSNPWVLSNIGGSMQVIGETDKGEGLLRRALAVNNSFGGAWFQLVPAMEDEELETSIPKMKEGLEDPKITDHNKHMLNFALGRALEKLKRPREAVKYLVRANDLMRQNYDYTTEREKEEFDGIKRAYTKRFAEQWKDKGYQDNAPIFILGMPRSGTTLTEQIISRHPEVFGAGELRNIPSLERRVYRRGMDKTYPESISKLTEEFAQNIGEAYCNYIHGLSEGARFVTDKMPHNFLRVGFIRTVLPNAKIIHVNRDPRDNCWSIFKQSFGGYHPYSYNLKELGEYHMMYQDLMSHWRNVYPNQFYELQYEQLVANPEEETRRLIDYCGLEWHDDCLNFHKKGGVVKTASKLQVRKPMYKSSVAAWEPFRKEISPLLKALQME